jgi:hypothetical protein
MNFIRNQKGITLTGMLLGCVVLGAFALLFMKLWPVYNDKFKVDAAMERLQSTAGAERMSRKAIARLLQKQFDVNGIEPIDPHALAKTLKVSKKKGSKNKLITLAFEIRSPVLEDLDVVLKYNKTVEFEREKTD